MRKVLQLLSIVVVGIAVALMLISPEMVLSFRIAEVPRGGVRHSAGGSECVPLSLFIIFSRCRSSIM